MTENSKIKSWVAVNRNPFGHGKKEVIFSSSPFRISISMEKGSCKSWVCLDGSLKQVSGIELPNGTIEKLIGRKLTWEDGYVCLDGENNYEPRNKIE